ncbi:hypothetical protein CYY_007433 [Polysphondylium violaceum]|uniref:Transmembrane protein n=1 Tax=Polysphondylium violaceum TaxID=133409 RepID=A0A8J4UQW2_9MYCE|nr:hypothetical protein CYY_007433 [Polysphondylium violaceum]
MGATGKAKVILWIATIIIMLAGSLGIIIYNKPLQLTGLGVKPSTNPKEPPKDLSQRVWFNAVIALHSIYLIGVGFEIISRAYLMMVGSTCSEQRRGFLCCFVYSMSTWWKLMLILGVITFIIMAGLSALIIVMAGFPNKNVNITRIAATCGVSLVQVFLSIFCFVTSRKTQKFQDEEEEALHGSMKPKEVSSSNQSTPSSAPPAYIQEKESTPTSSAVIPA